MDQITIHSERRFAKKPMMLTKMKEWCKQNPGKKALIVTGHPSVLLFGCESDVAIRNVMKDLAESGIEYIEWADPDAKPEHDDYGLTGIVSQPITKAQRNKLARYRTWTDRNNTRTSLK